MPAAKAPSVVDVVIVGAGFAGMYMLHRLRGLGMSARIFVAASAGIAIPVPGAADPAARLEYARRHAETTQPMQHVHAGETGTDDDDIDNARRFGSRHGAWFRVVTHR